MLNNEKTTERIEGSESLGHRKTAVNGSLHREMESFSSIISHDFRAPVRRIIGMSHILIEDHSAGLNDVGRRYLGIISSEAMRMNEMITDLMVWSRTSARELNLQEVDLSRIVNKIIKEEQGKENSLAIEAKVQDNLVVRGDDEMINMVLRELIENSVKFAHRDRTINIEFGKGRNENGEFFFVRDNGIGFDMSRSNRLFEPFQRLHGDEYPGEGMGLAIADMIVVKHGGSMWADSAPGMGTTFYFNFKM